MSELDYFQLGYITTDWKRAMAELSEEHGIGGWMEMADAHYPTGEGREAHCHIALAFKAGLQFEVIEPIGGDCDVYRTVLPDPEDDAGYALRYHHLGRHFASRADFDARMTAAKGRYAMPIGATTMGGEYAYFDARADYGHFLEYVIFPADSHLTKVPRW